LNRHEEELSRHVRSSSKVHKRSQLIEKVEKQQREFSQRMSKVKAPRPRSEKSRNQFGFKISSNRRDRSRSILNGNNSTQELSRNNTLINLVLKTPRVTQLKPIKKKNKIQLIEPVASVLPSIKKRPTNLKIGVIEKNHEDGDTEESPEPSPIKPKPTVHPKEDQCMFNESPIKHVKQQESSFFPASSLLILKPAEKAEVNEDS